jgi:hypothetical protein
MPYFENTCLAHQALFVSDKRVSYFQLQRALKKGKAELFGYKLMLSWYQNVNLNA